MSVNHKIVVRPPQGGPEAYPRARPPEAGGPAAPAKRRGLSAARQVQCAFLTLVLLVVIAVFFYSEIEGWPLLDSLFMVAITTSTVGYGEVHPLTERARMFSLFFIVAGAVVLAWSIRSTADLIAQAYATHAWRRKMMDKVIAGMKDHYIVCGYGRMGQEIVDEFVQHGAPVVVIEGHPETVEKLAEREIPHVDGDATTDQCLFDAGIKHAKGLVSVTNTDENNVFITLSGRELNPDLTIIARCDSPEAESKLSRAGADRVISPYAIGARRMAHMLLRPVLTEFLETVDTLETMAHCDSPSLQMGDVCVQRGARLHDATLDELPIKDLSGALIVAIRAQEGHFRLSPPPDTRLQEGDVLIALGTREQLERLGDLAARPA